MKNIQLIFFLIITINGYSKTPLFGKSDSSFIFFYNVQLRADFKTPFENQFIVLRPKKLSYSLKIANVNYEGENLSVKVNSNSSYYSFYNNVRGFTLKPGILFPVEQSKRTIGFIGINGVFSHITNETNLYYRNTTSYNEKQSNSKFLFGAELELTELVIFLKHFHTGISGIVGYKDLNVYELGNIIDNFPKRTKLHSSSRVFISASLYFHVIVFRCKFLKSMNLFYS